jgi:hypothetical protein
VNVTIHCNDNTVKFNIHLYLEHINKCETKRKSEIYLTSSTAEGRVPGCISAPRHFKVKHHRHHNHDCLTSRPHCHYHTAITALPLPPSHKNHKQAHSLTHASSASKGQQPVRTPYFGTALRAPSQQRPCDQNTSANQISKQPSAGAIASSWQDELT